MLSLYEIKKILTPVRESEPVDDFRILDTWLEYDEQKKKTKYFCYRIEVLDPETGKKTNAFKALRFARVERLPKSARQSTSFMDMQSQVLSAVHEQRMNLVTVIANIINPDPLGLMYLYGVQGVATSIEEAKKIADKDFVGFTRAMVGTFRVLHMREISAHEGHLLNKKMQGMRHMTAVRGIPKANTSGEDAGNKGMGGANLNPDSEGTLEEIITAMADYEYVIEVLSTPVYPSTLAAWQNQTQKQMTEWNGQLSGTKSLSMNLSMPMMFMTSSGTSQGWSKNYTDSNSISYTHGESYTSGSSDSHGYSLSQSLGESFGATQGHSVTDSVGRNYSVSHGTTRGQSIGTTEGITKGQSVGDTVGFTHGRSVGYSQGVTRGTSNGVSASVSQGNSIGSSVGTNRGLSLGRTLGTSVNHSVSQGVSQNYSMGQSKSSNVGTNYSENIGNSMNVSHGQSSNLSHSQTQSSNVSYGSNEGVSQNVGGSVNQSVNTGRSNGVSIGGNESNSMNTGVSHGESEGTSASGGAGVFGISGSAGWNSGSNDGHSASFSQSNGLNYGSNAGSNASVGQSTGMTHGNGYSSGISESHSAGLSDGYSVGQGRSYSEGYGTSYGQSQGVSYSNSVSESQSHSIGSNSGVSQSIGSNAGSSYGQSSGVSQGQNVGENLSVSISKNSSSSLSQSMSQNASESLSQSQSHSISDSLSRSLSNSTSQSQSISDSESNGTSRSQSVGESESSSYTQSETNGQGENWSQSNTVSKGKSYGTSNGQSIGQSLGTTGAYSSSTTGSMGLGPSIGYTKSYQWKDQHVQDILEMLEFQNERLKKAQRGSGAFYTYVYIACPHEDALAVAKAAAKATWQNEYAMTNPLQVLDLGVEEQQHLLYHFSAFSSDITRENVYGVSEYKYATVLLPNEYVAYTHLPRVSDGGIDTIIDDIPKFRVAANMRGNIYMGTVLNAERFTFGNGYSTPYDYKIDIDELMHGVFTGQSRSGKTVAAMRFIRELANSRRTATGKRLRIVIMDPKQDWRGIARFVEPERFRFYSMGNLHFRPINLNPCKIPYGVEPQHWIDGIVNIYCRAYGLLERGKQMLSDTFFKLYQEAGVFDENDAEHYPDWKAEVSRRSAQVTFHKIYKDMKSKKDALNAPGKRAGNDTIDAYSRLLERLSCFDRSYSIEYRLFSAENDFNDPKSYGTGVGVDELIGQDDITVFESFGLESTFANFIFGIMTSGFYKVAKSIEKGFLNQSQYETVLVIEEANKVLTGSDTAGTGGSMMPSLSGQSEFEEILDQSAGYGLFIFAITQKISMMPSSIVANCGLFFMGKLSQPEDVDLGVRMIGRENRIEDRDVVKWLPKSPTGWFICRSSRGYNFIDAEPVLVKIEPLNNAIISNAELEEILQIKEARLMLKKAV